MTQSRISPSPFTATELRRSFLKFFEERGHAVVPSAPLVPIGDPTLLFTTAGMVQFKPYYTASGDLPYTRAVSVQKCLRLTDIENVGRTPRHMTFFEMLGNFSFGAREKGAYFKEEAIAFAWEFVTRVLGLPRDRLYASIFEGEGNLPRDDEAAALWKKVGLPSDHIVALGRTDNFWGPAGGQGACGPCSEIYFDLGEIRPSYLSDDVFWGERPGDPGDRFMEFWNLVFPQFDVQPDGKLVPLARPGIDTGMGLERLAMIQQGKQSIFEADSFEVLINQILALSGRFGSQGGDLLADARLIADHTRALTFAIAEGMLPGNEGAGYVLRRLLRRAVSRGRSGQRLGLSVPVIHHVARHVIGSLGADYPELKRNQELILRVLQEEEASAIETSGRGSLKLEDMLFAGKQVISGEEAFNLHDTFGFSIDELEFAAAERGVTVDRAGFERAMQEQRRRARERSKFKKGGDQARGPWHEVTPGPDSEFLGYRVLTEEGLVLRRWRPWGKGDPEIVLDRTPFYAEAGGQVADIGELLWDTTRVPVHHVYRENDSIVHQLIVPAESRDDFITAGSAGKLWGFVDANRRLATMRHHTATHLLHAMLRHVLGTHVQQSGSLVAPDRLRFDYTHFEAPSREQLEAIERMVNEWIFRNPEVSWTVMPLDQAKALGAMALFGEKYGAEVRMVSVPGIEELDIPPSRELCGGTHVSRTGDIGAFVVVGDTTIASGVRRIEALCGHEAVRHFRRESELLGRAAAALQVNVAQLPEQIDKLKAENERLKKAQTELQRGGLEAEMLRLVEGAEQAAGGKWIVAEIKAGSDANAARDAADKMRARLQRGAALLAIEGEGKTMFLAAVTDDLVSEKRLRADELVRAVAQVTGGSGGGKPHLALAGAKDTNKLPEALEEARRLLKEALS